MCVCLCVVEGASGHSSGGGVIGREGGGVRAYACACVSVCARVCARGVCGVELKIEQRILGNIRSAVRRGGARSSPKAGQKAHAAPPGLAWEHTRLCSSPRLFRITAVGLNVPREQLHDNRSGAQPFDRDPDAVCLWITYGAYPCCHMNQRSKARPRFCGL